MDWPLLAICSVGSQHDNRENHKMKRTPILVFIAAILAFAIIGCAPQSSVSTPATSSPAASATASATAAPNTVTIKDFAFNPTPLNINKGDTVTWVNEDLSNHIVLFPDFTSTSLAKGAKYTHTFNETGTFDYHCGIHLYMKGQIIVN
jgi:plastocyanin